MVWNTIAHPKMMGPGTMPTTPGGVTGTPMPLQHVSTGKQNVYDLILSVNQGAVTIAYGDYDDLCAKLVRGELVLCTSVTLAKVGDMTIMQLYSPLGAYNRIAMMTGKTIHGKPVISVMFGDGSLVIDCNNTIYVAANAPFDPAEPDGDPIRPK